MQRFMTLVCIVAITHSASADDATLERLRNLKLPDGPEPTKAWIENLGARRKAVNQADINAWQKIQTKEDWEKLKQPRIEALRISLGRVPEPPERISVKITATSNGAGFRVHNLVYQSRPGFWVTANLYEPERATRPTPGIVIIASHHNPKTQGELQDMGMIWARLGCQVLVPDQIGHGERRQHPFTDADKYPGPFKVGRQDYYFRYNAALQLHLIGDSLMGWMAWDMSRGVDLLLARPGIDPKAIIVLGSVAGGGDPAAVTAALDPRIAAAAPFNFGGPQPETRYPLPADAETSFNYLGGGSWESTRGLRHSGKGGFLPWVIVGSLAPRGLIYSHEFAWDRERDPVWARLQKIYGFYGAADRLAFTHGRGGLSGKFPEATHCNNIGAEHRRLMYPALQKWFDIAVPEKETQQRLPSDKLLCWTDEARKKIQPQTLRETVAKLADRRLDDARKKYAALTITDRLQRCRKDWAALLGPVEPALTPSGYTAHKLAQPLPMEAGTSGDGLTTYCLLPPTDHKKGQRYPVVVTFAQGGIEALAKSRAETYSRLLEKGVGVCLVELRGQRVKDRGRASSGTSLSASEQMLGETVVGHQLRELRELLALLRKHQDIDGGRLALWGDSLQPANDRTRLLEVPLDAAKMPDQAEPGAALVALLGGLFEPDVRAVVGRGGLVSYRSILESPFVYVPHDAVIPGALTVGDWSDLVAALAPRRVRLEAVIDGLNRRVSTDELARVYAKSEQGLTFAGDAAPSQEVARWLIESLTKD